MQEIFDNIRKLYRFYVPDNELAEYIEFFSESSAEETYRHVADRPFSVRMFPSWTPTAYINLGVPYQMTVGSRQVQIPAHTDVLILRNSIVERHNLPTDHIVTIKFHPGGLEAILSINQAQFTDQVVALGDVLPVSLIQEVKELATFEARVAVLEAFFLQQYHQRKSTNHYHAIVTNTIGTFEANGIMLHPSQLADRMFMTSKTINRYFHRVIGTSPKQYLTSIRVRAALAAYVADKKQFAPDDYGYYDMSHFYKDVVRFTGERLSR